MWTRTKKGHVAHIDGDLNSDELSIMHSIIDEAHEKWRQKNKDFRQLWDSAPGELKIVNYSVALKWFEMGYSLADQRNKEQAK